ncbi:unnamed protein product [Caenorhabditis nigoni]
MKNQKREAEQLQKLGKSTFVAISDLRLLDELHKDTKVKGVASQEKLAAVGPTILLNKSYIQIPLNHLLFLSTK